MLGITLSRLVHQDWNLGISYSHMKDTYPIITLFNTYSILVMTLFVPSRNPDDDEPQGPWCYTTDPDTRWEYCDVPLCGRKHWG